MIIKGKDICLNLMSKHIFTNQVKYSYYLNRITQIIIKITQNN